MWIDSPWEFVCGHRDCPRVATCRTLHQKVTDLRSSKLTCAGTHFQLLILDQYTLIHVPSVIFTCIGQVELFVGKSTTSSMEQRAVHLDNWTVRRRLWLGAVFGHESLQHISNCIAVTIDNVNFVWQLECGIFSRQLIDKLVSLAMWTRHHDEDLALIRLDSNQSLDSHAI